MSNNDYFESVNEIAERVFQNQTCSISQSFEQPFMNHDHELISHDLNLINHDFMNHDDKDKRKIINILLEWNVYYPEKEISKYGLAKVKEAVRRTVYRKPRIHGAFYKTVVKNL